MAYFIGNWYILHAILYKKENVTFCMLLKIMISKISEPELN